MANKGSLPLLVFDAVGRRLSFRPVGGWLASPFQVFLRDSKRVFACWIHAINPALIQKDNKDNVVPKAGQPMGKWLVDDKGKQVVNDGVERAVYHHAPGQVGNRLELVVDEQLRCLHDEA